MDIYLAMKEIADKHGVTRADLVHPSSMSAVTARREAVTYFRDVGGSKHAAADYFKTDVDIIEILWEIL